MAFIDTFDGAASDTNLESWTPSGGGAWTKVTGPAGAIQVKSTGAIKLTATSYSYYTCTNQGSADQEIIFRYRTTASHTSSAVCLRMVDGGNFIGVQFGSSSKELLKRDGGTWMGYGNYEASVDNEWIKVEARGTTVKWYKGGTGSSPSTWTQIGLSLTISEFSTETSAGIVAENNSSDDWITHFEARALSQLLAVDDVSQAQTVQAGTVKFETLVSSLTQAMPLSVATVSHLPFVDDNRRLGNVVRFRCFVDGVQVGITSFQIRKHVDRGWFLQVVTKDVGISIDVGDTLTLYGDLRYLDGATYSALMAEVAVTAIDLANGATSQSLTISGQDMEAVVSNKTRRLTNVTDERTFSGVRFLRTPIDVDINQGDNLFLSDDSIMKVSMITYFANDQQAFMEVSE